MSNYPETTDIFVNKSGSDSIASSDPNNAFDGIEAIEGFLGASGKPQSWSITLLTLLRKYSAGMQLSLTSGTLLIKAGEAVLENSDGSKLVFRRNTGDVTIAAGNLDSGSLIATTYTVYLTGGSAISTSPVLFSTNILAPSGYAPTGAETAPYRKIGWFKNEGSGVLAITYCGDLKTGIPCVMGTYGAVKITQAHGLGECPKQVFVYYECISAELNYSVGDRIVYGVTNYTSATYGNFVSIEFDATNVSILPISGTTLYFPDKTSLAITAATSAKWKIVAVAYL